MGSMFDTNPNLIQEAPRHTYWPFAVKEATPLVLIHDGGGTVYSYHLLGELGRQVYGIFNPNYESGKRWEGGIPEMARHYLGLIKAVIPSGKIIIGGWSLGGLLSLEVAHLIAVDPQNTLDLLGIVMIDSVCPIVSTPPSVPIVPRTIQWSKHTKQETRERVLRCFDRAREMLMQWKLPEWAEAQPTGEQQEQGDGGHEKNTPPLEPKTASTNHTNARPPKVILLRAMEAVPAEGGIAMVDTHRDDRLLGWGQYREDLITTVMDIPGHHYNIFEMESTEAVTEAIRQACLKLEAGRKDQIW
ncbi:alpha/beta-hydrolase [Canariomyces notabilis]|uniref:Alpha/beta-hydrolase n=1 Tax=Canariomyces notabilis TaxID=2074819 RepID=A0AAN6YUS5_9PEZI|nr:alpha/beta-hydrolase [Canariomyces arenarius]